MIYFDFESLKKPVDSFQNNVIYSSTGVIEVHQPCGFCLVVIELDNQKPAFVKIERSENCVETFVHVLEKLAREVYEKKQQHRDFRGSGPLVDSSLCWLCEFPMAEIDKVLDHCHFTGKFLGYAHSKCNLEKKTVNYVPILVHNLSNYDLQHICKNPTFFSNDSKVQVIPVTDEKYLSLSIGVKGASYVDFLEALKKTYTNIPE